MKNIAIVFFLLLLNCQLSAQISPFGTGQITNQNIGQLDDPSVVISSQSGNGFNGFFPDAQQLLEDYNFDIYVPEDYDGTEAYGLVTFINSGNNGGFKSQWLPVLDDKKLIWIAGDQIGNSIFINIRMGVGMAAALRMQELFNIDTDRIYTSGNSGGARMAHNLAYIYPETFKGAMPSCGGSYIREVDQDYETQNPDSHYESILNYPTDYVDYLLPFDQRIANMTSFNDFREGDIMNIYHNGSEEDGLKGKFLETSGGHCSTTTEHFADAINFVEHPFLEVINEPFNGSTDNPFLTNNATLSANTGMELAHLNTDYAQIQSQDLFLWDDPMGAILSTAIQLDPAQFNSNTSFDMGIWSMENPIDYCGFVGTALNGTTSGILLSIDFNNAQPTLNVTVENPSQPDMEVLFSATLIDWEVGESLPIKYHLWDKELRIELGGHLAPATPATSGIRLLDDARSIRIRWDEIAADFWESTTWVDGAFLTLTSEQINPDLAAANLTINNVSLIAADTNISTEIPNTAGELAASICEGENYIFNDEGLNTTGTYTTTLTNSFGCDSLVTLNLTVNALPTINITQTADEMNADPGFQTYQWFINGTILDGETGQTLIPLEDGEYYVEVTDQNGCTNTSNILTFINTATSTIPTSDVQIYPNPTTGLIKIEGLEFEQLEIIDVYGQSLLKIDNLVPSIDINHLPNGAYIVRLQIGEQFVSQVVIKK